MTNYKPNITLNSKKILNPEYNAVENILNNFKEEYKELQKKIINTHKDISLNSKELKSLKDLLFNYERYLNDPSGKWYDEKTL